MAMQTTLRFFLTDFEEKKPTVLQSTKAHANSASGFSGDQFPVDEDTKTGDAARLSEESPQISHTLSVSGYIYDQGIESDYIDFLIAPAGISPRRRNSEEAL